MPETLFNKFEKVANSIEKTLMLVFSSAVNEISQISFFIEQMCTTTSVNANPINTVYSRQFSKNFKAVAKA